VSYAETINEKDLQETPKAPLGVFFFRKQMIFKAIEFTAKAHSGHSRKGTELPYIIHPLGVAKILIECDCPEHVVVAGILHDTVEDTPVTLTEIKQIFGEDVADLVESASEPDKSDTWENRKNHTIGMVNTLSNEAIMLVFADKLDNIRAIREDYEKHGEGIWHRFNRPWDQQKWYYESLSKGFTDRLTDERCRDLLELFKCEVTRVFENWPHQEIKN
jgi:(p)ppGpp synthase/HD superfamily hydrolase